MSMYPIPRVDLCVETENMYNICLDSSTFMSLMTLSSENLMNLGINLERMLSELCSTEDINFLEGR